MISARAQEEWNFDETAIPDYVIPDVLAADDGHRISDVTQWESRREAILDILQSEMYGRMPSRPEGLHFKVENVDPRALGGKAVRKEVKVFPTSGESMGYTMLIYIPKGVKGPVPAFLGLNFQGNHTICDDPGISIYDTTDITVTRFGPVRERGSASSRWPVEMIVSSGYALATVFYEDIAFDPEPYPYDPEAYPTDGVLPLGSGWGTVCAWAWGLSRAMDYLVTDPALDPDRIAVIGHSRLGKTALWAAAMDRRFAMAVSCCSGCCGAALFRRQIGETLSVVGWFAPEFFKYVGKEDRLPFDQHFLLSLIAPRPVYVTSATRDLQADPHGEFLSGRLASPVYALYGEKGLVTEPSSREPVPEGYVYESGYDTVRGTVCGPARDGGNLTSDALLFEGFPKADTPLQEGNIGYHIRSGEHDMTVWDWEQIISFADKRLR